MKTDHRFPFRTALGLLLLLVIAPASRAQDEDDPAERKVMERFLTVLEKTPRRGTALDRVYGYHVEHGSLDTLVKRYEDRTKAKPDDAPAWLLLGLVEAQRGRDASAVAALRQAEKLRSDDPLASYYLGQALVLVGQPDTAVEAFERALTRKPSRADLLEMYQALGRVHQRARRTDKALAVWSRLEATFPDDNRVREQIAAALAEEDQPAQALAKYELLARDVKDEYRKVQFTLEAAELKVRLGRSPDALADFERLLGKLDPGSWLFKEVRRKIEEVFLRGDDIAGLARYYEGWIAKTPDDVDAMTRLAKSYAQLGRASDSRTWLDKAMKLAPSRRELRLALIEQLAQEKKFAEAASQYESMARAEPNNPDLVRDWGKLLLRDSTKPEAERRAAAAAVWKRLAGDEVKDPVAIAQAADTFRSAEMVDDALALYKRAIALAPDSSQYREYLGEYYHQLKRPADALSTWLAAPTKTAAEKGRLGEVLSGFGYRKEALPPMTEAVKLAPDDFDLRLRLADLLVALDRSADALAELAVAGKLADASEQVEAVLDREIHAYQASKTLAGEVARLQKELDEGKDATAARWVRLSRYFEADNKANEAIAAVSKGTVVDPKSVRAWSTLARLQEGSGNLGGAAEANRKLADLDRRNRADYLSAIARLEARLGRVQEALKAGRELLAAAPGNVEHHQEFAELCFNLGEVEEGLQALRRASRANPSDPKASTTLADALSRQFRTEEAIELYWRAFDRTRDLDGRLPIVSRLADQYLQRNQFDRLIARLERELREPERRRELALCLAQAYQGAGDLGTARQQLETLLSNNPRDSSLLTQLANLAEAEGDVLAASRYLKTAVEIAPTPDGTARLGNLYLRAGEVSEAEAVWSRLASADQDAGRAFTAIDSLLVAGKYDTVLTLTEKLLIKRPDDWDALYREGVALINLDKPVEARRRFEKILELRANDDDPAAIPRSKKRSGSTGPSSVQATVRVPSLNLFPAYLRQVASNQIRWICKLDTNVNYSTATVWTPIDFGQSRLASIGWIYAASLKEKDPEAWAKSRQAEAETPGADPRALWDLYYLQLMRAMPREVFAATTRLARALPGDPAALYVFLTSLPNRVLDPSSSNRIVTATSTSAQGVDKTPPLPPGEQALVLDSFESLRKRRPDLVSYAILYSVTTELKRAKRDADSDAFYKSSLEAATTIDAANAILSLVADRGDIDGLIGLLDRLDRLSSGSNQPPPMASNVTSLAIVRAMGTKADEKDYAAILRLLDYQLDWTARPDQLARRMKAKNSATTATSNNYRLYTGKTPALRSIAVDFPIPNPYFDRGSIHVLRNAFEIYKKDDVTSDLLARLKAKAEKADGDAKLFPTLATSYLLWWNDEKDEALREYNRAADLARNDVELKLSLAELRAQRGEPVEALEVADSVEPLDQKTMQRRETLALRLAVLGGDVDRARKASERLFGLRLDADTQVQLATQMNQLGMHDLSEAVLARARRRSGGNSSALVSLMNQYQKQGKADIAVQVASQILRQTTAARSTQPNVVNAGDQARAEAVQVFARSGKLKELIARAESQLETSPTSQQLLQTLVEYYQADGQRDKVKSTYARIAKLRPDDARLQLQIGIQLSQAGAAAESLEHFKAALKKEPALFANQYNAIQRAFQQAGRAEDLVKLYEGMDFKVFQNQSYIIHNMLQNLMQNPKTRDQGMAVLRKAWKDMPESRSTLLGSVYDAEIWKLPEVYDYAREAVIPPPGKPIANPWAGLDDISSWGQDAEVTNVATQLIDASNRQGKLDALAEEVDTAAAGSPDWLGGKALLAILKARKGKVDEARAASEPFLQKGTIIPMYARMVMAQEIGKVDSLRDVATRLLEASMVENLDEIRGNSNGFQYGPGKRLVLLYQKAGRAKEARDLVLKVARTPADYSMYAGSYAGYQKVQQAVSVASTLSELGYPVDAARVYSEIASDTEAMEGLRQTYSGGQDPYTNQIAQGLARSLQGLEGETLAKTVRAALVPRLEAKPGEPRLDLVVLCHPKELDKAAVVCLFAEAIKAVKASKDPKGPIAEARAEAERLVATYPDDLSVLVASAMSEGFEGSTDLLAPAVERLARWLDVHPLEALPPSGRANARQREEAARQLPLWVVARDASKHDATRSIGEKLATRALEAARRQVDSRWTLAMLRESAQDALDRGDKPNAEVAWRSMLNLVMAPPAGSSAKPARTGGPAVITIERFEQVAQLARLAAEHDLPRVSTEAMREALAAGPPVTPIAIPGSGTNRIIRRVNAEPVVDPVAQKVEEQLFALDAAWANAKADPASIYEVYREAVLPQARTNEVFLYARPLSMASLKLPRSVGALLVRWAVKAGKADELKFAIEARAVKPLAAAPARVLLAQLAYERKNYQETSRILDAINNGMVKEGLAVTGEQACYAALPALEVKESAESAARVLESSIARIASTDAEEPIGSLLVRLSRHELSVGRQVDARKHLDEFLTRMEKSSSRYVGDYSFYRKRYHLTRAAAELARSGPIDDAFDILGQYADTPVAANYGDTGDIGGPLAKALRMVEATPPDERYRRLKEWTFPTKDRKSIRWLLQPTPDLRLPAPFVSPRPVADRGLVGTPLHLIQAARSLGRLDELAAELGPMALARVENAEKLLALVELARGDGRSAIPTLRARLLEVKKPADFEDGSVRLRNDSTFGDSTDELYARDALASTNPEVVAIGEELAGAFLDAGPYGQGNRSIGRLRKALAESKARRAGAPSAASLTDPGLALWSPRRVVNFTPEGASTDRPLWLESEGIVSHVVGNGSIDLLLSRVPMVGTFEFSVDAYSGSSAEGTIGYGGLFLDPTGLYIPSGIHTLSFGDSVARPSTFARVDAFNRITVRVAPGKVSYLVNGHLFYEDTKATPTSPWLALNAVSQKHTAFRNPTLTGRPEILSEVALSGGDGLDGWDPSSYSETTPPRRSSSPLDVSARDSILPTRPDPYDWRAVNGEILGRRLDSASRAVNQNRFPPSWPGDDEVAQSRLAYVRPLEDGDSISYEFFYQAGETMVHPAVGHLAFLIEPEGVRLHALVPLPEGIGDAPPSNVLDDPSGRREAVTLKTGEWNSARVRIKGATLGLEVNGKLVYERDLDPDDDRIFSLYHDKAATAARARNLVLRGNWPTELTAAQLGRPFVRSGDLGDRSTRRAVSAMIEERFLALSAGGVARSARKLPALERYQSLLAWVLPGDDHASTRLAAEFVTGDEAPSLDSPAIDLVAAASQAGKLGELLARIEAAEIPTLDDARGRLALLTLVLDASGRPAEAEAALKALTDLARTSIVKTTPDAARWPELIAGSALAPRPGLLAASTTLLDVDVGLIQRDGYSGPLERPLRHARGVARLLASRDDQPIDRREWVPAIVGTAETRGRGYPLPTWTRAGGEWRHTPGHNVDLLFLASPLRGDFEIHCELTTFGDREARLSYGGTSIGLNGNRKEYEVQRYGRSLEGNGFLNPPLAELGEWYAHRVVVKGGRMTIYAQGRKIDERAVSGDADPWLALVASGSTTSRFRNLKITGSPTIPDRVLLSNSADLTGWVAGYFGESNQQGEDAPWQKRGEEIVGRKLRAEPVLSPGELNNYRPNQGKLAETIAGSKHESVLRYARPIAEDGEISYEFFHDPGKATVHPSLDRLAFLVEPEGMKIHRITDGKHDRTGLDPGNSLEEPASRRGPARLPLKPGDWNKMTLAIKGDEVTLTLNDELVFARKLEPTNRRDFGLFSFADEAEVRVRDVVYRGDWPKALPTEIVGGTAPPRP